jgi:membrane fusion protein, multidrug efflux system
VIQRTDPIYVDLQQSSAELIALRKALASGGVAPGSALVRLTLEDGTEYGPTGIVQFSEITVNEATGTVTLRARFPNPQGLLLPGMFVTASFDQSVDTNAFLVPQAAVQRDFGGDAFVYLVGPGNKVVRRTVVAPRTHGADWVVTSGLRPGDKVIVQGLGNNLRAGATVRPVPASAPQPVRPMPKGMGGPGGMGGAPGSKGPSGGAAPAGKTGPASAAKTSG